MQVLESFGLCVAYEIHACTQLPTIPVTMYVVFVLVYTCLYWQGRTAVADCQIINQSINHRLYLGVQAQHVAM